MMTKYLRVISFAVCLFIFVTCQKKDEEKTGEISQVEGKQRESTVQTIKPEPINYDSMLVVMGNLIDSVKKNPDRLDFKRELVTTGYDTLWGTILAPGIGKSTSNQTAPLDRQSMERAAIVDAYRWAAYIKKWYRDSSFSEIGSMTTRIDGGRIVAKKTLPDNSEQVLLEIKSSQIP